MNIDKLELDRIKFINRLKNRGIASICQLEYEKYLRSNLWMTIKSLVATRDQNTCVICRKKETHKKIIPFEVHHINYDEKTLLGYDLDKLVYLCPRCHHKIEFTKDEQKRFSISDKQVELERLSNLHKEILDNGLLAKLTFQVGKRNVLFNLTYVGDHRYLEFYSLRSLLMSIYFKMSFNKDIFNELFKFSINKFNQKTGANLIAKATNKARANFKYIDELNVSIKVDKDLYDMFFIALNGAIAEDVIWKINA